MRYHFYYWRLIVRGWLESVGTWIWTPRPIWWLVASLALWGLIVMLILILAG